MNVQMSRAEAKAYVDEIYRKVAQRWQERVTASRFMTALVAGKLPKEAFCIF